MVALCASKQFNYSISEQIVNITEKYFYGINVNYANNSIYYNKN